MIEQFTLIEWIDKFAATFGFAVLYGALFLGETITPWMIGCALVIVCGTMLSTGLIRGRGVPATTAERA